MLRTRSALLIISGLCIVLILGFLFIVVPTETHKPALSTDGGTFSTDQKQLGVSVNEDTTREKARASILAKLNEDIQSGTSNNDTTNTTAETPAPDDQTTTPGASPTGAIPLGDGKLAGMAKAGYIYSCQTNFNSGGAEHAGDWISGDYWYPAKKPTVEGAVSWTSEVSIKTVEGARVIDANGLPEHTTGIFPIQPSDDAYQYDRNPNSIAAQSIHLELPQDPVAAASPSCLPMGMIGVALNGVAIFNGLDDAGRDAVAHEVQDKCEAHPQSAGEYHYHGPSDCMPHAKENNALVGYALDGFGIYSKYDASGKEYTDADLDACHGITSEVLWDGKVVNMYHYVLTTEYPYTLGCFKGTPVKTTPTGTGTGSKLPPPPGGGGQGGTLPPPPSY